MAFIDDILPSLTSLNEHSYLVLSCRTFRTNTNLDFFFNVSVNKPGAIVWFVLDQFAVCHDLYRTLQTSSRRCNNNVLHFHNVFFPDIDRLESDLKVAPSFLTRSRSHRLGKSSIWLAVMLCNLALIRVVRLAILDKRLLKRINRFKPFFSILSYAFLGREIELHLDSSIQNHTG